jgi:hypothetical protein
MLSLFAVFGLDETEQEAFMTNGQCEPALVHSKRTTQIQPPPGLDRPHVKFGSAHGSEEVAFTRK